MTREYWCVRNSNGLYLTDCGWSVDWDIARRFRSPEAAQQAADAHGGGVELWQRRGGNRACG
jgi:hypothetical protein